MSYRIRILAAVAFVAALVFAGFVAAPTASADPTEIGFGVKLKNLNGTPYTLQYGDAVWACSTDGTVCVNNFDMGITSGVSTVNLVVGSPSPYYWNFGFCKGYIQRGNTCGGNLNVVKGPHNVQRWTFPGFKTVNQYTANPPSGE